MTNLSEVLRAGYSHRLDATFLHTPGADPLSFAAVEQRAAEFAGALEHFGVAVGDRVAVQVTKSTDAFALYLACLRRGVIYLPLNTAYTPTEVAFFVEDAEPALVVTVPGAPPAGGIAQATLDDDGTGSLVDAAAAAAPVEAIVERADADVAAMLYTSGTTGRSKGAMLTHGCLADNGRSLHQVWSFQPGDVLLHSLPIFHVHGLFIALHPAMLNASETIFLPRYDVDEVLRYLPHASIMMGVPTHYTRLLADDRFNAASCRNVRLFTSGSAPMTEAVHREFEARTGQRIVERYGMTEAGIITSNPYNGERLAGTVGFPLPGVTLRIADETGAEVPVGETGVVEITSPSLFAGYWRLPEKTASEFRADGFFITGDVGSVDAEGRVTLEGRSSDMIISGGLNVYPKEIEMVLDEIPGVVESAVVGLPDDDFGERVVAYIVPVDPDEPPSDKTLSEAVGELARFKHPKQFRMVAELPRNAMGKVQKTLLRQ